MKEFKMIIDIPYEFNTTYYFPIVKRDFEEPQTMIFEGKKWYHNNSEERAALETGEIVSVFCNQIEGDYVHFVTDDEQLTYTLSLDKPSDKLYTDYDEAMTVAEELLRKHKEEG